MDSNDSRCFDDRLSTFEDPDLYKEWVIKLRRDFCLPQQVIDAASNHSNGDVIGLLQYIDEWLSKRNTNTGVFNLPVNGWERRFPRIPDTVKNNAKETYQNDKYSEWKHLVRCTLKEAILSLKSQNDETSETVRSSVIQGSVENTKLDAGSPETKDVRNFDPMALPIDLKNTHGIKDILKWRDTFNVMQLYGGILAGKTYTMLSYLETMAKEFKQKCVSSIIWKFDCQESYPIVKQQLTKLCGIMEKKGFISFEEYKSLDLDASDDKFIEHFIKLLREKEIETVLAFDDAASNETDKSQIRQIMNAVIRLDKNNKGLIRVIAVTRGRDDIYNPNVIPSADSLCQYQVNGYTVEEALEYLRDPSQVICFRYVEDDDVPVDKPLFTEEGARELARYFNFNPGSLKAAYVYCITRKVSFTQYIEFMNSPTICQFTRERETEILEKDNEKDAKAYRALYALYNPDDVSNKDAKKLDEILRVLRFVSNEDIPLFYIGKVCEYLRSSDSEIPEDEIENMNGNEASNAVYRLQEYYSFKNSADINYPNGAIDIPKAVLDAVQCQTKEEGDKHVEVALKAMVRMVSKDNTIRNADIRLAQLRPHILALAKHATDYLKRNFNAEDKKKDSFIVAMNICRLFELLGQASIQGRLDDSWQKALGVLLQAAFLIWDIVSAYCSSSLKFLCFRNDNVTEDVLKYQEQNSPEEQAKIISKKCIKAGKNVPTKLLDEYFQDLFVFNKNSFEDFVANTTETLNISEAEAQIKLEEIKGLVDRKRPCTPSGMKLLRETGNLLKAEELQVTFFAERLSSIFHTYGRQVLYLQSKMPLNKQKECEYYTQLAHHIAKSTRVAAGLDVGLLNEFIAICNGRLPRLLHNREDQTAQSKLKALDEAYELAQKALDDTRKYYENGCYKRTKGSDYTKLNACKYLVKVNTKRLKYIKKDALPKNAWEKCATMLRTAKANSKLDMAPHCMIMAAKFYAATGCFREAFDAFAAGFNIQHDDGKSSTGMLQLRDWRPNSLAWAVNNYCMAVDASFQLEKNPENVKEKLKKALDYCLSVRTIEKVSKQWKDTMEQWVKKFETLSFSLE